VKGRLKYILINIGENNEELLDELEVLRLLKKEKETVEKYNKEVEYYKRQITKGNPCNPLCKSLIKHAKGHIEEIEKESNK
jgi:hypothetical protein